ncbi:MAG: hypothetical protein AAF394_05800 [Planctomycetota bacterium]
MILHQSYPTDIRAANLAEASRLERDPDKFPNVKRSDVLAVIDILDLLDVREGPEKWVRLNHDTTLSFFHYDPAEFVRQRPQVIIWCRKRYSELEYLLPSENWPWDYAKTIAIETSDAAELIVDAFTRCETRHEFLIEAEA